MKRLKKFSLIIIVFLGGLFIAKLPQAFSNDEKVPVLNSSVNLLDLKGIRCVAFSPDGEFLAAVGYEKNNEVVKIWNTQNWKEKRTIILPRVTFHFTFSPNGKFLATAGKTICLWEAATGKLFRQFQGEGKGYVFVAWSPDGKTLAASETGKYISLWDITTGKCLGVLKERSLRAYSLAFFPEGKNLASGNGQGTVVVWDVRSQKIRKYWTAHVKNIKCIALTPNGKTMVTVGEEAGLGFNQSVKLWDPATGKLMRYQELNEGFSEICWAAFSPDSRILGIAGMGPKVQLWDVATDQEVLGLEWQRVPYMHVCFSPNGKLVAAFNRAGIINVWKLP